MRSRRRSASRSEGMPRNSFAKDAQASRSLASMPTYDSARISIGSLSLSSAALSVLVDGLACQEAKHQVVVLLGVLPLRPVGGIDDARELRIRDRRSDLAADVRSSAGVVVGP